MSLLSQYTALEAQIKELQSKKKALETNNDMKKELEFKEKIEQVMQKYDKSSDELLALFKPYFSKKSQQVTTTRKPRKLKIYRNPNTGEVVETYGGNNKQLREWKDEHGGEVVDAWLINADGTSA